MEPLKIYNELKSVPKEFLKEIGAGRLKGMSDIKPQWRIMKLTEIFGACGFGWKVQNVQFEYKEASNNEVVVNCRLEFLYRLNDIWSEPIPATGGSKLATQESKGLYVSDEAEKMAYTDALSVAGKMIGLASDIYMGYGGKYDKVNTNTPTANQNSSQGQNLAPSSTTGKKVWFSLYTKDKQPIQKNINWVLQNAQEGYTVDQIVKAQEKAGKSIYTTTLEQIKKIVQENSGSNEVIIQDDDIELEEIPF
jgi:hypothetical protein